MARRMPTNSHRPARPRLSFFADLAPHLQFEARLILAWLWAPLKSRFESMLRFGLRSNITTMIMDRSPGQTNGDIFPRRRSPDRVGLQPASSIAPVPIYPARRGPKRFLAARYADE
jgi:hypothetical protein